MTSSNSQEFLLSAKEDTADYDSLKGGSSKGDGDSQSGTSAVFVDEKRSRFFLETIGPFLLAGLGTILAGLTLDYVVVHVEVFRNVTEMLVLVPPLLGLKGNLEMTLASRLSTHANVGDLSDPMKRLSILVGNMALVESQATLVALLAAAFATIESVARKTNHGTMGWLLTSVTAVATAVTAGAVLACIMMAVVICAHRAAVNPDNVTTPIAAALGDLVTTLLIAVFASGFYDLIYGGVENGGTAAICILFAFLILTPVFLVIAHKNDYTNEVLFKGLVPVVIAMLISTGAGFILEGANANFTGFAKYAPLMNGVGGNLVAVYASRLCTDLHKKNGSKPGKMDTFEVFHCISPLSVFWWPSWHSRVCQVLLSLLGPGHALFVTTLFYVAPYISGVPNHSPYPWQFLIAFLIVAYFKLMLLLYFTSWLVPATWHFGLDPDSHVIPYVTALSDLFGTALLLLICVGLKEFGYDTNHII